MPQFQLDQDKPQAYPHHARYGSSAQLQVIGPDGQPQNRSTNAPQNEVDHHLNTMYTREKPLLEKIREMREEYEQLQEKMKAMQVENNTLKEQLKIC